MTYELCTASTLYCPGTYRTSDDGWDFGPPSNLGTTMVTGSGQYFQHVPRNIWFPRVASQNGSLVVVGQVLFEKDGTVSPQDGEVLFVNSSEDGSGEGTSVPAPVKILAGGCAELQCLPKLLICAASGEWWIWPSRDGKRSPQQWQQSLHLLFCK